MPARILIVEDQCIVTADLERKLTRLGYQVVGSTVTGEEAIVLAEGHRPDVVLMDIQLQGRMNGMEAAETIRARHRIPILFITAFAGMLPGDKESEALSEMCLSKPFSVTELMEKLEACLGRERSSN